VLYRGEEEGVVVPGRAMRGISAVAATRGARARPQADNKNAPILYVAIRLDRGPTLALIKGIVPM